MGGGGGPAGGPGGADLGVCIVDRVPNELIKYVSIERRGCRAKGSVADTLKNNVVYLSNTSLG